MLPSDGEGQQQAMDIILLLLSKILLCGLPAGNNTQTNPKKNKMQNKIQKERVLY